MDLSAQVKAIAATQKSMESKMTSTIKSVVSSTVSSELSSIKSEVSTMKQQQGDIDSFIALMKKYVETSDKRYQNIQNSFSQLGVPAQTPSEAQTNPPGVVYFFTLE